MTVDARGISGLDNGCIGRSGDRGWISSRGGPESKEPGCDITGRLGSSGGGESLEGSGFASCPGLNLGGSFNLFADSVAFLWGSNCGGCWLDRGSAGAVVWLLTLLV